MSEKLALIVGVLTVLGLGVGRLAGSELVRRMRGVLIFLALAAMAEWGVAVAEMGGRWEELSAVAMLLALVFLGVRLTLLVVFEWLLVKRVGMEVPRLARDVVALLLYLVVAATVLRAALGIEVGALLATSAVLTVVIGLALQETLGTLLAGLALAWERRLEAGVWVELDGIEGAVEELGWRSLVLRTNLDERILIPNSSVARSQVKIFGTGAEPVAFPIPLGVAYGCSPYAVRKVLQEVAAGLPFVADHPAPVVFTREFADSAVVYECRVWTREPSRHPMIVDEMLTRAHAALARAGMEIPFPQRTLHLAPRRQRVDHVRLASDALAGSPMFSGLPDDAVSLLAESSRWLTFVPGEAVVREGEESRALYVVGDGEAVAVRGGQEVGRVGLGEVFGEIAFLSGSPRAATVQAATRLGVVEVDTRALRALLSQHSELAEELAGRMEARQQMLAAHEEMSGEQRGRKGLAAFLRDRLLRLVSG